MSVSAEGVASGDAFCRKQAAFECAIFFDCFDGILRTGRRIAAAGRNQRADVVLVAPYQNQQPAHAVSPDLCLFFVVWVRTAQHELRQFFPCLCRSVPAEFPMGADNEILRRQLVFI